MNIKEKFSSLPIEVFGYNFNVYYVKNDNTFWYEIIANKDDKEYYVCKLDYAKTNQGIKTFLLKDVANDLKQKYTSFNFKVLKSGIKLNDKIFHWKKQKSSNDFSNDFIEIYDLKIEIIQYIANLQEQNILVA